MIYDVNAIIRYQHSTLTQKDGTFAYHCNGHCLRLDARKYFNELVRVDSQPVEGTRS